MVGINDFPRMIETHSSLSDQANMIKEASEKAISTIDIGKNAPKGYLREVLKAVIDLTTRVTNEPRLRDVLNAVVKLSADSYSRDYQVKTMIKDIAKKPQLLKETPKSATYAQAIGRDSAVREDTKIQRNEQKDQRTIRVKMNNPQISVENKKSNPRELSGKVNKAIQDLSISQANIGAAKALHSTGDIEITAASKEEADKLRKDQRWTQALAATAQVKERTFGVIVKGVLVQDLRGDQASMRAQIQEQNRNTMELDPYWVGYLHRPREGESRIPLVVEVKGVNQANQLIRKGICIGAVWYSCEVYNRRCRLTQCFKCWRYGHMATVCPHEERCGQCGGGHNHLACASVKLTCAGCGGEHEARSKLCTSRAREVDRIERIRKATPSIFPEETRPEGSRQPESSRRITDRTDNWQEVALKGKKRKIISTPPESSRTSEPGEPTPNELTPIEGETQSDCALYTEGEKQITEQPHSMDEEW